MAASILPTHQPTKLFGVVRTWQMPSQIAEYMKRSGKGVEGGFSFHGLYLLVPLKKYEKTFGSIGSLETSWVTRTTRWWLRGRPLEGTGFGGLGQTGGQQHHPHAVQTSRTLGLSRRMLSLSQQFHGNYIKCILYVTFNTIKKQHGSTVTQVPSLNKGFGPVHDWNVPVK